MLRLRPYRMMPVATMTYCALVREVVDDLEIRMRSLLQGLLPSASGSLFETLIDVNTGFILLMRGYTDDYEATFPVLTPVARAPQTDPVGQQSGEPGSPDAQYSLDDSSY